MTYVDEAWIATSQVLVIVSSDDEPPEPVSIYHLGIVAIVHM